MDRRAFLTGLAGAAMAAAAGEKRPNVVVILADDLGWHDVGYHGSEIATPNIDRLAAGGVKLERAYSCPVCSPTRSMLMTGRSAVRLGLGYTVIRPWEDFGVSLEERFMPQAFKDAGYQTGMAGKWHLGHSRKAYLPVSRGFDSTYGHLNGAIDYFTHERDGGLDWARNAHSMREEGYSTTLLGAEARRFIRQRDKTKPFFFYLPFNSPHAPLEAPPDYLAKYASIKDEKRRTYAAMVTAMDDAIGGVLETLQAEGIEKDTLVLFFSDNGGPVALGATNTPLRGAKATTFEGGTRVPAVMRWPGKLKAGTTSQQVMTAADYFPTLTAAVGVKPGNVLPLDGKSMWTPVSGGKTVGREDIYFSIESGRTYWQSVRSGEWKLVRQSPRTGEGAAVSMLFNVEADPNEANDLASKDAGRVKALEDVAAQWAKLAPANSPRESGGAPAGWKAPAAYAEAAK